MKIWYVVSARIPTEKAHGYQIMKMCEAFAKNGIETHLVVPARHTPVASDAFSYYGIDPIFDISRVPIIDFLGIWPFRIPFVSFFSYYAVMALFLLRGRSVFSRIGPEDAIYVRSPEIAWFFRGDPRLIFEVHELNRIMRWYVRHVGRFSRMIAVTRHLAERLVAMGVPSGRVAVAHDAVDPLRFSGVPDRAACRRILGIASDVRLVAYVGRLSVHGVDKGVRDAIAAIPAVSASIGPSCLFSFVGGPGEDISAYRALAASLGVPSSRCVFTDQVPWNTAPLWMRAADALIIPLPWTAFSAYETSPLKLFEYMASDTPIVATDLPSLREILIDGETAMLVPPGDPSALAAGIASVILNAELGRGLAARAAEAVRGMTWRARARAVLDAPQ